MSTRLADLQVRREMPADLYHLACVITPHPTSLTEAHLDPPSPSVSFYSSCLLELFLRRSFVNRVRELRRGTRHRVFTRVDAVSESLPLGWEEDDPPASDRYISAVASTWICTDQLLPSFGDRTFHCATGIIGEVRFSYKSNGTSARWDRYESHSSIFSRARWHLRTLRFRFSILQVASQWCRAWISDLFDKFYLYTSLHVILFNIKKEKANV